ncbi:hypothetical protein HF685_12055 [Parasphingorhabdus halotolerans]|uniref:Uncharacterized protein n=1 Tax=Parasphingorhabdus halotolerans TaxID=2725558 RepID=A0A6H2DP61_9SPHN|nr:hypothetical protein HF685_12055 [Parasphingorhabdus halotolerans]
MRNHLPTKAQFESLACIGFRSKKMPIPLSNFPRTCSVKCGYLKLFELAEAISKAGGDAIAHLFTIAIIDDFQNPANIAMFQTQFTVLIQIFRTVFHTNYMKNMVSPAGFEPVTY